MHPFAQRADHALALLRCSGFGGRAVQAGDSLGRRLRAPGADAAPSLLRATHDPLRTAKEPKAGVPAFSCNPGSGSSCAPTSVSVRVEGAEHQVGG
jgi:hypothetical protein